MKHEEKAREEMTYPLIPIYSLIIAKLVDIFYNNMNKVIKLKVGEK